MSSATSYLLVLAGCGLDLASAPPPARAAAPPPLGPLQTVSPLVNLGLALRHCSYVCSVCPSEVGNLDFSFLLVAPLNGATDGMSFSIQSAGASISRGGATLITRSNVP